MTNNLECTVGLAIPSDTSPLFSVAIELRRSTEYIVVKEQS